MLLLIARELQVDVGEELAADSILDAVDREPSFAVLFLLLEKEWANIDVNEPDEVVSPSLPHTNFQ